MGRVDARCVRPSAAAAAAPLPSPGGASRTVSQVLARTGLVLKRVLVADGDPAARRLLCTLLGLDKLGLLEARDGVDALAVARFERPEVAVLDLAPPPLGGLDVCRALRADAELASIKVVILSERDQPADRAAADIAGADAYLAKPYSPLALLDVVQRLSWG